MSILVLFSALLSGFRWAATHSDFRSNSHHLSSSSLNQQYFIEEYFFEEKYSSLSNVCILANNGRERGTHSYAYDARCRPFSILLPRKKPAILGRRTKTGDARSRQETERRRSRLKVRDLVRGQITRSSVKIHHFALPFITRYLEIVIFSIR